MSDPVAVVTGAGSGIGRATALSLSSRGWSVAALDINKSDADETASNATGITPYAADVSDEAAVAAVVSHIETSQGPISALINNAGIGVAADTSATTVDAWRRTFAVNVDGAFNTCRNILPLMLGRGSGTIVNVASIAGIVGLKNRAAYCASKAAVIGLTRAIAADHAAQGVRANAIAPGTVETPWIGKILQDAPDADSLRSTMAARQLDGRMGTPEEVAAGICFLVSTESRFVNGTVFVMDGGLTAV